MSLQRPILILASLFVSVVFGLTWSGVASARPSFATTNGNSCRDACHVTVESGRIDVTGAAGVLDLGTQLDGSVRGPLKVFTVDPGNTVTLSVEVLNGDAVFALQLKRLEKSGQLNDLANFMTWLDDNLVSNPWTLQEVANPAYFTKDNGSDGGLAAAAAGVFTFDLFIDAATPPDVYDVEFAYAGLGGADEMVYQDEHFYVQVVPEPAVGALAMTAVAALGAVSGVKRRLGSS